MNPSVLIRGEGIAGSCCARLLGVAGVPFIVQAQGRPRLPAVMLTETTQKLLRDVFERDDLFAGLPQVRRRIVKWGPDGQPLSMPHSAVVVSEQELLGRIQFGYCESAPSPARQPAWTIFASAPLHPSAVEQHFGSRFAAASRVALKSDCHPAACWTESLESGWLFLLPSGNGEAWLLSVGGQAESLLASSRLVNDQIATLNAAKGTFASHPRLMLPLCEPGWLACGSAALGFDPLCGDGVGNAVREAILASAVVRAALQGGDASDLVGLYKSRLLAGLQRHLELCRDFYSSGSSGPWWERQLDDLQRGAAWCAQQVVSRPTSRYRLDGFSLEVVD
jgi:hypothetical protein